MSGSDALEGKFGTEYGLRTGWNGTFGIAGRGPAEGNRTVGIGNLYWLKRTAAVGSAESK